MILFILQLYEHKLEKQYLVHLVFCGRDIGNKLARVKIDPDEPSQDLDKLYDAGEFHSGQGTQFMKMISPMTT